VTGEAFGGGRVWHVGKSYTFVSTVERYEGSLRCNGSQTWSTTILCSCPAQISCICTKMEEEWTKTLLLKLAIEACHWSLPSLWSWFHWDLPISWQLSHIRPIYHQGRFSEPHPLLHIHLGRSLLL